MTFETLAKFEGISSFNIQNLRTLTEDGTRKKLIKAIARDSRPPNVGKTEVLTRQPDLTITDKNGNFADTRPPLIFAVTLWIPGEDNNSYVGFDFVFRRNEIDKIVPVQTHFAWRGIDFSELSNPSRL